MAEKVFTNSAEFQYHKGGWGGIRLEVVGRWGVSYLFRKNLELLDKTDSADRVNHTLRGQIFGYFTPSPFVAYVIKWSFCEPLPTNVHVVYG